MTVIGRDTDGPFHTAPDTEPADQPRPPVDHETMRRLRTPFATRPAPGAPGPQGAVAPDHNHLHGGRPDRHPHGRGNRG